MISPQPVPQAYIEINSLKSQVHKPKLPAKHKRMKSYSQIECNSILRVAANDKSKHKKQGSFGLAEVVRT